MGMCVDLKVGETLVAYKKGDEAFRICIKMDKRIGNSMARLVIEAPKEIVLVPPNQQKTDNTAA